MMAREGRAAESRQPTGAAAAHPGESVFRDQPVISGRRGPKEEKDRLVSLGQHERPAGGRQAQGSSAGGGGRTRIGGRPARTSSLREKGGGLPKPCSNQRC